MAWYKVYTWQKSNKAIWTIWKSIEAFIEEDRKRFTNSSSDHVLNQVVEYAAAKYLEGAPFSKCIRLMIYTKTKMTCYAEHDFL